MYVNAYVIQLYIIHRYWCVKYIIKYWLGLITYVFL